MKLSKKMLTGCVMAALAVGISATALAATVKEDAIKYGNVHIMTPFVEQSLGGAAVDKAVSDDLSTNTFNVMQGLVSFKHVEGPKPITAAVYAKNTADAAASRKTLNTLGQYLDNNFKKTEAAVKSAGKPYTLSGKYDVKNSTDNTLSIVQTFTSYTGGAHSNTQAIAGTYDLKTGKKETLADQFATGANYKARLMTLIGIQSKAKARILSNVTGKKVPVYAPKSITGNENFYIDGKNAAVVVFYNPGEIAPISEGVVNYSFGIDTIGDIMKL
jgi:hypothetical protein